jgi:hypothetical protein
MMPCINQMPFVITLVHGTWAQDAEWTKEGSPLRTAIQSRFRDRVEFRTFYWSGGNSFAARLVAASTLRAFIRDGIDRFPNARHSVVAHSHGGNVVLLAVEDEMIRSKLSSLVTLATPFIQVSIRNFGKFIEDNLSALRWTAAMVVTALIFWVVPLLRSYANSAFDSAELRSPDPYWPIIIEQQEMYIGLCLVALACCWAAVKYPLTAWAKYVLSFSSRYVLKPVDDLPLLVIRAQADEASAALNFGYFIGWVATQLWRVLTVVPMFLRTTTDNWGNWKYQHPILGFIVAFCVFWVAFLLLIKFAFPFSGVEGTVTDAVLVISFFP